MAAGSGAGNVTIYAHLLCKRPTAETGDRAFSTRNPFASTSRVRVAQRCPEIYLLRTTLFRLQSGLLWTRNHGYIEKVRFETAQRQYCSKKDIICVFTVNRR